LIEKSIKIGIKEPKFRQGLEPKCRPIPKVTKMADTEISADTDTEISAETDTETDNFRSLIKIDKSKKPSYYRKQT
jgi:hypothetical protein